MYACGPRNRYICNRSLTTCADAKELAIVLCRQYSLGICAYTLGVVRARNTLNGNGSGLR